MRSHIKCGAEQWKCDEDAKQSKHLLALVSRRWALKMEIKYKQEEAAAEA